MKNFLKKSKIWILISLIFMLQPVFSQNELSLIQKAEESGITFYWDSFTNTGMLEKNNHQLTFRPGEKIVVLDSSLIIFSDAPSIENNEIKISKNFFDKAAEHFSNNEGKCGYKIGAIIIDPGHGGKDPGAIGTITVDGKSVKVQEKDVVLTTGKKLYAMLKKQYPEKQIIMTRSTDIFLTLNERTDIANNVKLADDEAILFVAIHANASLDKKSSGYEVWYLSPGYRRTVIDKSAADNDKTLFPILNSMMEEEYTTESILIAKFIMDGLQVQIGDKSKARGIKAEEWFVVKHANMPSVLIEVGFVTNQKEAQLLHTDDYLQKTALGIYNGINAFVTHFERSRGFTSTK
ncbi:MAG: N-acetylmuramoyl-L-alanine amidase [Treponema sp.]|nr:N-acetylmuramoyl-L-alanine amidase [Treponema sp.]